MDSSNDHQALAVWALRYIKNPIAVADYLRHQRAMSDDEEFDTASIKSDPNEFLRQFQAKVDAAITWVREQQ